MGPLWSDGTHEKRSGVLDARPGEGGEAGTFGGFRDFGRQVSGPPAWDDAPEPMPDWDLLAQPAPDFEFDQRVSW